jgi:hypothetical protein
MGDYLKEGEARTASQMIPEIPIWVGFYRKLNEMVGLILDVLQAAIVLQIIRQDAIAIIEDFLIAEIDNIDDLLPLIGNAELSQAIEK